jgi:hypothetical protein
MKIQFEGTEGEISFVLKSEFSAVQVRNDHEANGPRLEIRDMRTGSVIYLDPLELESLVYIRHEELTRFLDPGLTRWSGD